MSSGLSPIRVLNFQQHDDAHAVPCRTSTPGRKYE
jgi:hypothetical protein